MPLNLIDEAWIPVRTTDGSRVIRPDQIAEPDVLYPDWPRADLNLACLEFLIGLVHMAMPPHDADAWDPYASNAPTADLLRSKLAPLAPAFNLGGDGPRFLQDLELLEGNVSPPDMLFIDSAGVQTAKNNADLMVWRNRYPKLDAPLAAMALFTLQSQAPSGGAGNRTSMRGGGPMITLVQPAQRDLWSLVWANVLDGAPQGCDALPWMHPTRTSDGDAMETYPRSLNGVDAEAFFGMPRRIRLVFEGDHVSGVIQRPWGTDYAGWVHPLSPYYRVKAGTELLPKHPRAEAFGYRNWLGTVVDARDTELAQRAACVRTYRERAPSMRGASIIVGGWAMDNMKSLDFILSHEPLHVLDDDQRGRVSGMIEAADRCAVALRMSLKEVAGEGTRVERLREDFFADTYSSFVALSADPGDGASNAWLNEMRRVALDIFDRELMGGLDQRDTTVMRIIVDARSFLLSTFAGRGKFGREAYLALGLPSAEPVRKGKANV